MAVTAEMNDALDDDMSGYTGLVIGAHKVANGEIAGVQTYEFGRKVSLSGFSSRLDIREGDQDLVMEANRLVDEKLSSGELKIGEVIQGNYVNRTSLVHVQLERLLNERRAKEAQEKAMAKREPAVEIDQIDLSAKKSVLSPNSLRETFVRQVDRKKATETKRRARSPEGGRQIRRQPVEPQFNYDQFGIPGFSASPPTDFYARLRFAGGELKFKFNWGVTVGESQMVLVKDCRHKPMKESLKTKLMNVDADFAELAVAGSPEEIDAVEPDLVHGLVNVFDFGCFSFVQFLLRNEQL